MWKLLGITLAIMLATSVDSAKAQMVVSLDINSITLPNDRNRQKIIDAYNNSSKKDSFTLAVGQNGSWATRSRTNDVSSADRQKSALQKCEHWGGAPCGLVIVDGAFVDYAVTPAMTYTSQFDVTMVPFIRSSVRATLQEKYDTSRKYTALALHRNGGYGYSYGQSSQSGASSKALGFCRENNGNDCFLYDETGVVVFTKSTPLRN